MSKKTDELQENLQENRAKNAAKTAPKTAKKPAAKTTAKTANPAAKNAKTAPETTTERLIFTARIKPNTYAEDNDEFLRFYNQTLIADLDDELKADAQKVLECDCAADENGANADDAAQNATQPAENYEQQLKKKGLQLYYFGKVRGLDMVLMHREFLAMFWREFSRARGELYELKLNRAVENANPRNATDVLCVVLEELGDYDIGTEMNFDNVVQIVKNKHPYLFKD